MPETSRPLFSVVIPVYNRSDTLARAVRSAFEQTITDVEVLVIDDGSDDESSEVARRLRPPAGASIQVIQCAERRGGGSARNVGIDAASGEYLAFLDSDDQWEPSKLERQLEHLRNDPQAFCLTGFRRYLENTVRRGVPGVLTEPDPLAALLGSSGGPLTCSIMAVNADVARARDLRFDDRFPALQDLDFAIAAAIKGFAFVGDEEPLVRKNRDPHREHVFNPENEVVARRLILEKYHEYFGTHEKVWRVQRRKLVLAMRQVQIGGAEDEAGSTVVPEPSAEVAACLRGVRSSLLDSMILRTYSLNVRMGDFLLKAGANLDRADDFGRWLTQRVADVSRDTRSNRFSR